MENTIIATAPSPAQVFNDQGVRRISPSSEIPLPIESAGSVESLIGPAQGPLIITSKFAPHSARAQTGSQTTTGQGQKTGDLVQRADRNNNRPNDKFGARKRIDSYNDGQRGMDMFRGGNRFDRHYIIRAANSTPLSTVNTVKAYEELKIHIGGIPKKIIERRDGSLAVTLDNQEQSERLKTLNSLAGVTVETNSDTNLNRSQGTIRYENLPGYTTQELLDALKTQNVTEIYQLSKKNENKTNVLIPVFILTFGSTKLPERINIGWTSCPVRLYIPRPRRCFKCQKFGHGSNTCRSPIDVCGKCGREMHLGECDVSACCVNCRGPHPSFVRACPAYKNEQEIIAYKIRNNVSYNEAKMEVNRNYVREDTTYSQAVTATEPRHTETIKRTETPLQMRNYSNISILSSPNRERPNSDKNNNCDNDKTDNDNYKINDSYKNIEKFSKENAQISITEPHSGKADTEQIPKSKKHYENEKPKRQRESRTPPDKSTSGKHGMSVKTYPIKINLPTELPKKKQRKNSSSHQSKR